MLIVLFNVATKRPANKRRTSGEVKERCGDAARKQRVQSCIVVCYSLWTGSRAD